MSLIKIASQMGVTSSSLEQLIGGKVSIGVAGAVGVISSSLQRFVDGGTSIGLAGKIGCTSSSLQELRSKIGQEGAVGLIIGLCMKARAEKKRA